MKYAVKTIIKVAPNLSMTLKSVACILIEITSAVFYYSTNGFIVCPLVAPLLST
jgi:hypothetical protein